MRHPHRALLLSIITVAGIAAFAAVPSRAAGAPDLDTLTAQQAASDLCSLKYTSTALVVRRHRARQGQCRSQCLRHAG